MADRLRSGIIGAGFIGGVHAHAVHASGGTLSVVADSTPEAAELAAARLGARSAARSAREVIESADVDVVHICTPNFTHADLARAAIEAGKTVICEKPLATTVADAGSLVDSADRAGLHTAVPFVYRFYPAVREARARISRGDGGPLWLLHGSYLQDWLSDASETNWRVDPRQGGGSRAFGDIGVHWCDLLEFVTGHRITRLSARLSRAFVDRPGQGGSPSDSTEDGAVVMFETDRGAVGSVVVSQVSPGRKNRLWFSFDGPDASYSFDQEQPEALWVGARDGNRVVLRDPATMSAEAAAYSRLPAGHPQGYQDSFNAFISDVYDATRGQGPDGLPTFTDGLRAAVITATVLESAATGQWIEVPA